MEDTGKDIIMTGWAGLNGSAILADKYYDNLIKKIPGFIINKVKELIRDNGTEKAEETAEAFGAEYFHVSEGGVYKALWDLSVKENTGVEVYLSRINIRQETIEICEYFDINPYMLNSNGSLLIISDRGNMVLKALHEAGIEAGIIGYTCKGNDKVVISGDVKSHIQSRIRDELFRFGA